MVQLVQDGADDLLEIAEVHYPTKFRVDWAGYMDGESIRVSV